MTTMVEKTIYGPENLNVGMVNMKQLVKNYINISWSRK